jgi:hypothetical protein
VHGRSSQFKKKWKTSVYSWRLNFLSRTLNSLPRAKLHVVVSCRFLEISRSQKEGELHFPDLPHLLFQNQNRPSFNPSKITLKCTASTKKTQCPRNKTEYNIYIYIYTYLYNIYIY